MKKILLLISLFVLGNTYGQIKTFKGNTFTSSQCKAGGVTTVYYPLGHPSVPQILLSSMLVNHLIQLENELGCR